MKKFFQDTLQYTKNCNLQLIVLLDENPAIYSGKIRLLISHTLNAHHIWNNRIIGGSAKYSVWQNLDLIDLKTVNAVNLETSLQIICEMDLNRIISYENSRGEKFTNKLVEIMFHIINHSTYHRGQLISLLKNEGVEPIITDYIYYKR